MCTLHRSQSGVGNIVFCQQTTLLQYVLESHIKKIGNFVGYRYLMSVVIFYAPYLANCVSDTAVQTFKVFYDMTQCRLVCDQQ
jgi:hypothetical protein